jgi:Chaperone for protein-folding within the ER, fungal
MVGSWRFDGGGVPSNGFYDPETMDFAEASAPGQYVTLTADGHFESGRVTRTGTGGCAVSRYEYHSGTVVVRDSVLILYATTGRIRSVAPCDLNSDYEKNDTGVQTLAVRELLAPGRAFHGVLSEGGGSAADPDRAGMR